MGGALGSRHKESDGCPGAGQALKGEEDLEDALLRNVYGNDPAKEREAAVLAKYVTR